MKKCNETIAFGDDEGDNSCTFRCQLSNRHKGSHKEAGNLYDKRYKLFWEDEPKVIESNEDKLNNE